MVCLRPTPLPCLLIIHGNRLSLGCDSKDNLLVVFRYNPQPGLMVNGEQEKFTNPPDASGTSFSMWGNSGFTTLAYSIDPDNADETFQPLKKVSMNSVDQCL